MSEPAEQDSKTEAPTDKKISDAFDKGNVPFSREAAVVGSMAGMLLIAIAFAGAAAQRMTLKLGMFIEQPDNWRLSAHEDGLTLLYGVFAEVMTVLAPVFLVLVIMGVAASALQNTPRFVLERIRPKASKLSLREGFKRLFGRQGAVEFAKATAKLAIIAVVAFLILKAERTTVVSALHSEPIMVPGAILDVSVRLLSGIVAASVLLAAADIIWSRYNWRRQLMMTRQEVKDEHKQSDGDPVIKSRLRALARDRSRKRMMAAVPNATLIVANPTHYAIALRFKREEGGAPLVLAKGKNLLALKIREIAGAHDIPIVEDKPLARSMYDAVEVGQMIPVDFYQAVAELIFHISTKSRPLTSRPVQP